jgi:hypothetical protein
MKATMNRFLVIFAYLLACQSLVGQTQCSVPSMSFLNQQTMMPCLPTNGPQQTMTTTTSYQDTCINTQTGHTYYSVISNNTGYGQCTPVATNAPCGGKGEPACTYTVLQCPSLAEPYTTTATSPSDYNRFYNRAYGNTVVFVSLTTLGCGGPGTGPFTQDFQQCQGQACPCSTDGPGFTCCSGQSPTCVGGGEGEGGWVCSGGATPCVIPPPDCGGPTCYADCQCNGWVCVPSGGDEVSKPSTETKLPKPSITDAKLQRLMQKAELK